MIDTECKIILPNYLHDFFPVFELCACAGWVGAASIASCVSGGFSGGSGDTGLHPLPLPAAPPLFIFTIVP